MRLLILTILILFSIYTGWIIWEFGYLSVFETSFREHPSTQVVIDLFIAGFLLLLIMVTDNKRRGQTFNKVLPFIILGLFTGAIGALAYFLVYPDLLDQKVKNS